MAAEHALVPPREDTLTIYERSREGRRAFTPPPTDVPDTPIEELLPAAAIRRDAPDLPEISEPEIVRHYNNLSKKNFDLDTGFYPLRARRRKHTPRRNERGGGPPGRSRLHPLQDAEYAQGAL